MATVWGGVHEQLGTAVAFKFLRTDRDAVREAVRFLDEARALARMNHPGIVKIYDAGLCTPRLADFVGEITPRTPYFVMEAVSGGTLNDDFVTDWSAARRVLLSLLDALAHAHARDVLHRDIKPSNVLIDEFGILRLTDFGIARLTRVKPVVDHVTGTPSYMAPEQITAQVEREGPGTDLYAIGCLAYAMVTGSPPFEGTTSQILSGHVSGEPPALAARFPIPEGFEAWCRRLLAKDPQGRFTRAADAAAALTALAAPEDESAGQAETNPDEETISTLVIGHLTADSRLPAGESQATEAPDPPEHWETPSTPMRGQLLSSGPGMLNYREPMFRGRHAERTALWNALKQVWNQGEGRSIGLTGPPGIGTSALARWFARRGHETGNLHVLHFPDDVQASAMEQLVQWWGEVGERPGATAFYAIHGGLDELAEWDLEQIGRMVDSVNVPGPALSAIHARWTARRGQERIALYIGESPEVVDLFQAARAIAPGRRMLVAPATEQGKFDETIALGPLERAAIEEIVSDLLGLSTRSARRIADRAEGNPGAATTWANFAAQNDLLVPTDHGLDLPAESLDDVIAGVDHRWRDAADDLDEDVLAAAHVVALAGARLAEEEFQALCGQTGIDPDLVLPPLARAGLVVADEHTVRFAHPSARRAVLDAVQTRTRDHEILHDVFRTRAATPRSRTLATYHGFRAGRLDIEEVLRVSRKMRAEARVEHAIELLSRVAEHDLDASDRRRVFLEIAECHLNRQDHVAAEEALDQIPEDDSNEDVRTLRLYLAFRRFEDVRDELLAIEPTHLSETACRMVAYTWMDLGEYEAARQTLMAMDATYDPPGRLYAFARLHYLKGEWEEAERFGLMAAERFRETGVVGGALAANDIVASSKLELGERDEAIETYRANLRDAERHGVPTHVQRYNLALALLKGDELTEEADLLLERVVKAAIHHGRVDLEHCARAAQALYAIRVDNVSLARHRVEALAAMELGPWLQTDSLDLLEAAYDEAPGAVAPALRELFVAVSEIVDQSTD